MNTTNEDQDVIYNSAYNPFPEPQTIPSGWDLSGIISLSQTESDAQAKELSETESN